MSTALRVVACGAPFTLLPLASSPAAAPRKPTLTLAIPEQPLADALQAFASQTGLQLVYVSVVVPERKSRAVAAGVSLDEALTELLQGTGLQFKYLTAGTVRILRAAPPPVQEVIVTAQRREQNLQEVPITVQALTRTTLDRLQIRTFDDSIRYLPGVSALGVGPAQSNISIRGLSNQGIAGIQSAGLNGTFPNVAVYLDEQSVQLPNRNLDVYAADLDRVEILEGPQGTLFGAGAEAGAVRYITNKPRLNVTEALLNAEVETTTHAAGSAGFDATVNFPVLTDRLAVRAVVYDERRGGYIDNVPATFARAPTDEGIHYAYDAGLVPANSVVIDNSGIVARHINPLTYQGARLTALYRATDDWEALIAQSYQSIDAEGVFAEMAADSTGHPQPDLSVALYNPSYDRDRFESTALTVNGKVGALSVIYAGSYLVRNVAQVQDYTNYARGPYADYYQCGNPSLGNPATARCFTPSSTWHDVQRTTHHSEELRLATPDDWRLRGLGGLFYEDFRLHEQVDWLYLTAIPYFNPIGPPTGYYTVNGSPVLPSGQVVPYYAPGAVFVPSVPLTNNPAVRPPDDGFFTDQTRGYRQEAAFGSFDFDLIPHRLTLTAGTRYFDIAAANWGAAAGGFGCRVINDPTPPNPCINHSYFLLNYNSLDFARTFTGFRSRANLTWRAADSVLLYYTWSQGFRAGGFNRQQGVNGDSPLAARGKPWQAEAGVHGGWASPHSYAPDTLINNELGWKTEWWDRHLRWNGAFYQEQWSQVQTALTYAPVTGLEGFVTNGGDYRVRGFETSVEGHAFSGFTAQASAAWIHSELVRRPMLVWHDGTPIDFSTLHTSSGQTLTNFGGVPGSPLAGAPPFQGTLMARYDLTLGEWNTFIQTDAVRQSHSYAATPQLGLDLQGNVLAYDLRSFTAYDAALGIGRKGWLVQLYGENLTDTRAELYANYAQFYKAVTVSRPRTVGLRFSYRFSDDGRRSPRESKEL